MLAKIIILIFVFTVGFWAGLQYEARQAGNEAVCAKPSVTVVAAKPVSLMIDYGNGSLDTFSMELTEETSVFDLLQKAAATKEIELDYKDYGGEMGVFLEAIGGVANNMSENTFWQYWLNNKYAQIGPGQQRLSSGDHIVWKYIKGQFE